MSVLVIKKWQAAEIQVNEAGHRIAIEGRQGGLLSWVLHQFKIEPVTKLLVTAERLDLERTSLSGKEHIFVPLEHICHSHYGYHKPWKQALIIWFLCWWLFAAFLLPLAGFVLSTQQHINGGSTLLNSFIAFLIATVTAFLYYTFTKSFLIGIETESGRPFALRFKRSLIENQQIDAEEAAYVAELLDFLCDARRNACKGGVNK
jgi:hypothetical protein